MTENPIQQQQNIVQRAREAMQAEDARSANGTATLIFHGGLVLSSLFTVLYMVAALGSAMVYGLNWQPAVAYSLGILLGLAAIAPGELGLFAWKTRLQADTTINIKQIIVAWIAGLLAAVSAAMSTVSFFAYLLQGLMPGWYNAEIAAGANLINIAAGWVVLGIGLFVYDSASSKAERNRKEANAFNLVAIAQSEMIAGIAQGIRDQTNRLVNDMSNGHVFFDDAIDLVAGAMGMGDGRTQQLRSLAPGRGGDGVQPQPVNAVGQQPTSAQQQERPRGMGFATDDAREAYWQALTAEEDDGERPTAGRGQGA